MGLPVRRWWLRRTPVDVDLGADRTAPLPGRRAGRCRFPRSVALLTGGEAPRREVVPIRGDALAGRLSGSTGRRPHPSCPDQGLPPCPLIRHHHGRRHRRSGAQVTWSVTDARTEVRIVMAALSGPLDGPAHGHDPGASPSRRRRPLTRRLRRVVGQPVDHHRDHLGGGSDVDFHDRGRRVPSTRGGGLERCSICQRSTAGRGWDSRGSCPVFEVVLPARWSRHRGVAFGRPPPDREHVSGFA